MSYKAELQTVPAHVSMLNLLGEYAGGKAGVLYYPGCGNDESPEQTRWYAGSTIYVDREGADVIDLHRNLGRKAFVADATEFTPDEQPDAVVFFNPSGSWIGQTIHKAGLKDNGFIGLASWDMIKITPDTFADADVSVRAIIKQDGIDEDVDAYRPIVDDDVLQAAYPERYEHLLKELREIGVGDQDIQIYGVIDMIKYCEDLAFKEMVDSGYSKGYWMGAYDVDIPSLKPVNYGLVVAQIEKPA
jgi:hypothetical protein